MSKQTKVTYVKLTDIRKQIVKEAIKTTSGTDVPVVMKEIQHILNARFADCTAKRKKYELSRLNMDTEQNIQDVVESYIAVYEDELIRNGYMKYPIGGMLRERIKIEQRKKEGQ